MADLLTMIEINQAKSQYDENAKQILAFKPVLAIILVCAVKDFNGMDPKVVEKLIEDNISIGETPVDPGLTNEYDEHGNVKITGNNTESNIPAEGVRRFDILFYVKTPDGRSKIIVNIEAQKENPKKYDVERRGTFYGAREISSQLDRDFFHQDYNSMCKVYSIWICMNTSENTIQLIKQAPFNLLGKPRWKDDFEILNIIVVRLTKKVDPDTNHKLHRLLGTLFSPQLSIREKEDILKREFDLDMSAHSRKELLGQMCNLSEGIWEQGIEKGSIMMIKNALESGMSEEDAKKLLKATEEQIREARKTVAL